MIKKKYITFDLDGTIMQNPFVGAVFPEIERIVQGAAGKQADVRKWLVDEHNRRMDSNQIVAAYDWDDIVVEILGNHKLELKIEVSSLVKKYSKHPHVYLLDSKIHSTLQRLREKGYTLIAATNGFRNYQLPVMEYLQIDSFLEKVITPKETGFAKPDPRMLEALLTDGEIVAHVGDRIDHDVYMANKQGWTSVWIHYDLPVDIQKLPPDERSAASISLCKEKWDVENKGGVKAFEDHCIPDVIISSISELEAVITS